MTYISYSRFYADESNQKLTLDQFLEQKVLPQSPDIPITLSFSYADLSIDELKNVMEKIKNHTFKKIDFSNNNRLGDEGACIIATALKTMQIGSLELSGCKIRDDGAVALAKEMVSYAERNNEMIEIAFNNNEIGPRGGVAIAAAASQCGATMIDLSNNDLGNAGVVGLVGALKLNGFGKINQLILKHNNITSAGDKHLAENVPQGIKIIHRVEKISWMAKHPILSVFLIVLFFPLIFILPFLSSERDVEGCEYRGHMRNN